MEIYSQCKNCKHFKPEYGIYGICKLVEGCIGVNCHKFSWCKDFEIIQKQEENNELRK